MLMALLVAATTPPPVIRMSAEEVAAQVAAMQNADLFSQPPGAVYDPAADADAEVAAALARARTSGKMTLIVLGANWCHDSIALAETFAGADFQTMLGRRYELVYVDVGRRDRNLQIPQRYGIEALRGTPTVLVIASDGRLLNRGTAASWRNAASRSRETIYAHFRNFGRGNEQ